MSTLTSKYWHFLNTLLAGELWKLLPISRILGGPEAVLYQDPDMLLQAGLTSSATQRIISGRSQVALAKAWAYLEQLNIKAFCLDDPEYPVRLKEIPDPPPIIYVRGNESVLHNDILAVVGSRKITAYGKEVVKTLIPSLVEYGITISSGMAFGVDASALNTCMDHGGTPISVLASSLDIREISPRAHLKLAEQIIDKGCLVSENPPGRPSHKQLYPLRNRIISGLSKGVVVIEGAMESGSLITAKYALEQNREVFAVPGPIFSENSSGTNDLIKRGAKCLTSFQDIAIEFGWDLKPVQAVLEFDNSVQEKICSCLAPTPLGVNEIISQLNLEPAEVFAAITELELKGILRRSNDGVYAKIK